jgi:outer membrane cobalamin receptor
MINSRINLHYICLLIFLLLHLSLSFAVVISASVRDEKGNPVRDVTVSDGYLVVFSKADGSFSIKTDSDSIIVSKLAYEQRSILLKNLTDVIILKEKPIILNTVQVIERFETPHSNALDKSIVDTDADKLSSATSDLLLRESAFHTSGTRLSGETQTLSLLGNLSRHTLFMLDNVPLNPNGEPFDLSTIPWENIKRIEIVKGNASLYGGASAIGGIVYLFTDNIKTAHPLLLEQETALGSFGNLGGSFVMEQQSSLFSYRVSFSQKVADNDFKFQPPEWWTLNETLTRENNRKEQQSFSFQLSTILKALTVQYKADSDKIYRQLPGPYSFSGLYENAYLTGLNLRQNLSFGWQKGSLYDNLVIWQNEDQTKYNNTNASNPVYSSLYKQAHNSLGLKNQTDYDFSPFKASLGLEASRQTYELDDLLNPASSIPQTDRNQVSVSLKLRAEDMFLLDNNQAQAGVRIDEVTGFGTNTSWRFEDVYQWQGPVELQGGFTLGTGFSLPSFYDLYWKGDSQSLGNPDLEPEASMGGSLSLRAEYKGNSLKAAYYASKVDKLIQWRQTYLFGTQWKPVNIGKAGISNWEINLSTHPLEWLQFSSSVTFTKAVDLDLNKKLTYTPEAKWMTDLTLSQWDFTLNLNQDYTGRQWKTPDNLIDPLPEYFLYNVALGYSRSFGNISSNLYFRLNNVFDRYYEIYNYVPQPGMNWLSGISLKYEM